MLSIGSFGRNDSCELISGSRSYEENKPKHIFFKCKVHSNLIKVPVENISTSLSTPKQSFETIKFQIVCPHFFTVFQKGL